MAWHYWLLSLLFIYLTLLPKIHCRLFPMCNFLLSWHIASSLKNIPIWSMRKEHMKDTLRSKAILAQIFCFVDHKRCCLAFILLGLCWAVEMTATAHVQIANIRKYWANDISVTACFSSWHHFKKIATIIIVII